ncbi:MAG: 3-isopropylmalate dehydratase [Thermoplasmata archaeon]|nr:3-isopropylmalate dehydratase [Thermoplasmata archaeon]
MIFKGRVWLLLREGKLIDDIDTDMIFHNKYLAITEIAEMGQYAFDNLEGYKDFAKKAQPGDIVITGQNFGSGSSRQHAVDCFVALKTVCVAAESFGAIYKRNAINSGFPILTIKNIDLGQVKTGDTVEMDSEAGTIKNDGKEIGTLEPLSTVQKDILKAGNVFEYAKTL